MVLFLQLEAITRGQITEMQARFQLVETYRLQECCPIETDDKFVN